MTVFTHLDEKNIGYFSHMTRSLYFSKILFLSSIKAFIHSILPCYFETSTSDTVYKLNFELNETVINKNIYI